MCGFGGSILRTASRGGDGRTGSAAIGAVRLTGEKVSEVFGRGVRSGAECAIAMPPSRQITCRPTLTATHGRRAERAEGSGPGWRNRARPDTLRVRG